MAGLFGIARTAAGASKLGAGSKVVGGAAEAAGGVAELAKVVLSHPGKALGIGLLGATGLTAVNTVDEVIDQTAAATIEADKQAVLNTNELETKRQQDVIDTQILLLRENQLKDIDAQRQSLDGKIGKVNFWEGAFGEIILMGMEHFGLGQYAEKIRDNVEASKADIAMKTAEIDARVDELNDRINKITGIESDAWNLLTRDKGGNSPSVPETASDEQQLSLNAPATTIKTAGISFSSDIETGLTARDSFGSAVNNDENADETPEMSAARPWLRAGNPEDINDRVDNYLADVSANGSNAILRTAAAAAFRTKGLVIDFDAGSLPNPFSTELDPDIPAPLPVEAFHNDAGELSFFRQ